jgi:GGDEF domain-containing protein
VISLRKFWSAEPLAHDDALFRVVRLLLQGIALHAVEGDRDDRDKFRADMENMSAGLERDPSPAALLMTTGSALKALEDYNQRTSRFVRLQGAELQNMIAMLTRTVSALGAGSERSLINLKEIEVQIEKASVIEDVRMLKVRMEQCLQSIREESQRQKEDSRSTLEGISEEISKSRERLLAAAISATDPVTGLPTRVDAEIAFEKAAHRPGPAYAAVFVVDRISVINARFGYAVGDKILQIYLEELRGRLSAGDPIFRWNGPALVVILERPDPIERVREQLGFLVPAKLDRTIQLPNRSALLPISATWTVFPVALPSAALSEQIDRFIAGQWQPNA